VPTNAEKRAGASREMTSHVAIPVLLQNGNYRRLIRNGVEKMPQAITRSRKDTELQTRKQGKGAIMEQVIHLEGANFRNFKPIIIFVTAKGG
jgi:hypothetical protein